MAFTIKSFEQIVSDMVAYIIAQSPQITDLSPGSVIRSYCEAAGLSLEEFYVSTYLGFRRYLDNIQETAFDFVRKAGVKASTNVVFGRTGTSGTIDIPIGTRVKTTSGLRFILRTATQILNGNTTSSSAPVDAEEIGVSYNVGAGTIIILEDVINGVETVTNALAAVGGINEETDYNYKQRFQAYIEGLGKSNIAGLIEGALSHPSITSASVVELFPPVSNINAKIYIDNGSSGGVLSAIVTEVQGIIDGDGTQENPGYRAAGVNVQVLAPGIVTQNVAANISPTSGVDVEQVEDDIITALTQYVNTLGVGADIIFSELISSIMSVFGVFDVLITTPTANITISSTQVGRLGIVTVAFV